MSTTLFIQPIPTHSTYSKVKLHNSSFSTLSPTSPFKCNSPTRLPVTRRLRPAPISASAEKDDAPPTPETPQPPKKEEQTFFGLRLRTNGDVIKFGIIATVIPFGIKAGLQATGVPDLLAGQMTTGFVSVFALIAWVSTYAFRVGTKQMTYAQQLRDYENQVIQKRYEELSEEELTALTEELTEES